jgi:hypothetical protein
VVAAGTGVTAAAASGGSAAQAAGATYGTSSTHKVLISGKCYRTYTHTVTYYHYSSAVGHYIPYVGGPHITDSQSTHCHA